MPEGILQTLQEIIEREIPMCAEMGMQLVSYDAGGLSIRAPLDPNRNHQFSAFAGSLNALCTMTGWATVYLLMRRYELHGNIVIRRSGIKYLRPVVADQIVARCDPPGEQEKEHFLEMLREKGQSKLDLDAEILRDGEKAVSFHGSYVVLDGDGEWDLNRIA